LAACKIFISYSHQDEALCEDLLKHLAQLRREGLIEAWHDRKLTGGQEWAGRIDDHLEAADIILLLISADFLNSDYCNDVELSRALERHREGTARVIPIILRPADWESAPFGKLQGLPKNGQPVTEWPSPDQAFLDVAKGLRRIVEEKTSEPSADKKPAYPAALSPQPQKPRRHGKIVIAAIAVFLTCVGIWGAWHWYSPPIDPQLAQAQTYMDMGRYAEAKNLYAKILQRQPNNAQARFGLDKAGLPELRSDPEKFAAEVRFLLQKAPEDSDLIVFDGDRFYAEDRLNEALQRYQHAATVNPQCAEAFFRQGVIYDRRGVTAQALAMYQKAVVLAPETPHYRENLAYTYYRQGHYDQAIAEYGRIDRYPLAALELAKVYWLKGDLAAARDAQTKAILWLEDDTVFALPSNQGPWYFPIAENQGVRMTGREEKTCYAKLSLAATLFLQGKTTEADAAAQIPGPCDIYLRNIQAVLHTDLQQVQIKQPALADRIAAYTQHFP